MKVPIGIIGLAILGIGCTSVNVEPLSLENDVREVCVEENPKVIVPNFLSVLREGLRRNGFQPRTYRSSVPDDCQLVMRYTARRSWDLVTYLSYAELWMESQEGRQLAHAEYSLVADGGFDFSKYASVKSKMDPVIDRLFAGHRSDSAPPAAMPQAQAREHEGPHDEIERGLKRKCEDANRGNAQAAHACYKNQLRQYRELRTQ